eukprot:XP_011683281.1 PREDICTED: uncharacterized protein LOC753895 [Strongylocentrotus purpuratus]
MFMPGTDYVGIMMFQYHVEDDQGRSEPSTVTINVQPKSASPSIDGAAHIIGLEDSDTELDFQIDDAQDEQWNDLSIALCSCAKDVTCDREDGCHCHLSLPDGWQIFSGDQQLTLEDLKSLSPSDVGNLVLRAAPSSAAQHCLDIHVIDPNNEDDPSMFKKPLNIHIHPLHTIFMKPQSVVSEVRPETPTPVIRQSVPVNLTTSQGRPYVFHDLRVMDGDGIKGTYMVTVHLDRGGLLWVRQDLRQDVVFLPLTEEIHTEDISPDKVYQLLQRFGTFKSGNRPFDLEENNNGAKVLTFIGSLEGINEVLATLTFIPWCSNWPVPPSWPVPAKSWMNHDPMTPPEDAHYPTIWPQWYPRFWYPFPSTHWSWWPRVMPPWWLSSPCSNWTSTVTMRVQEVPPPLTCQESKGTRSVSEWSARIAVNASEKLPKSLVTSNHFTYFKLDSRAVTIDTVLLRSPQYHLGENVTVNLTVVESNYATVEFPSTGLNYTRCQTIEQCNEELTNIKVTFKDGVQDVCLVTVQVDMYKANSSQLVDTLVVWAVNTTHQCADVASTHPTFELTPRQLMMRQGSVDNPLNLISNLEVEDAAVVPGILHVKLYAEHGIITMKVPDGLRIYSDHMGQHEAISSYLYIAGPVPMVLEALAAARFTPFEPLYGGTVVMVDYRMPSTASQLLYGNVQPFRRTLVTIEVRGGIMPYMPVVVRPQEMCVSESSSLSINQTAVLRRFNVDETVSLTVTPDIGSVQPDTSQKAMYECPIQGDPTVDNQVDIECRYHSDCQDNLLCCPVGPRLTCMEGTLKANILLLATNQVYMSGDTAGISEMFNLNAVRYVPAPCLDGETYTDNIAIQVALSRNPEGDDVRANIPIHVLCNSQSHSVLPVVQELVNCEWSDWTSCIPEGSVCGLGSQQRHQICDSQDVIESRPCLNCTCAPTPTTLTDPSPSMEGCNSEVPVLKCPTGCSVGTYHMQMITFLCQPTSVEEQAKELESLETNIKIHDSCVCNYCSSYQYQRDD